MGLDEMGLDEMRLNPYFTSNAHNQYSPESSMDSSSVSPQVKGLSKAMNKAK